MAEPSLRDRDHVEAELEVIEPALVGEPRLGGSANAPLLLRPDHLGGITERDAEMAERSDALLD